MLLLLLLQLRHQSRSHSQLIRLLLPQLQTQQLGNHQMMRRQRRLMRLPLRQRLPLPPLPPLLVMHHWMRQRLMRQPQQQKVIHHWLRLLMRLKRRLLRQQVMPQRKRRLQLPLRLLRHLKRLQKRQLLPLLPLRFLQQMNRLQLLSLLLKLQRKLQRQRPQRRRRRLKLPLLSCLPMLPLPRLPLQPDLHHSMPLLPLLLPLCLQQRHRLRLPLPLLLLQPLLLP